MAKVKTKKKPRIRPLAVCVFRHGSRIFVSESHDPTKNQTFYRPLGGGIDFGEYAIDTVKRELMEEIQQKVTDLVYLGTLENIFTFDGTAGHEIVLVFDGRFVDGKMYDIEDMIGYEIETDEEFHCFWKEIDFFRNGEFPLYPDGLLELLDATQ